MKKWWPREVLRFVDAWACREGTPEDDEDAKAEERNPTSAGNIGREPVAAYATHSLPAQMESRGSMTISDSHRVKRTNNDYVDHEWVELEERGFPRE